MSDRSNFELPDRYDPIVRRARALAARVAEHAHEADESPDLDQVMHEELRASGLVRLTVPAAYGGETESVDPLAITAVREVLMGTSGHLDSLFAMQGIGSFALALAASDRVKKQWLPRVAALEAIGALALTEPHIGSDLKNITTTITLDGDELTVSGRKAFITNAGAAHYYTVLATEHLEDGRTGYSLVLMPADAPGLTVSSGPDLMAPHIIGELELVDVRVPVDHRVGAAGKGFGLVLATLGTFRVSVAGAAVGLAQSALDEAVRHTSTRSQFGAPLSSIGAVSQKLALSWAEIEMARTFVYRAASAAAVDPRAALDLSSMAKVTATEMAARVVDRSVQVMGRFGVVRGSTIERLYREARPMRIYEGATEVLLDSLARQLIKNQGRRLE